MENLEKVVILDVVEPGQEHDYVIKGKCTCRACDEWCWLGTESFDLVKNGEAQPLCINCANKYVQPDSPYVGNANDKKKGEQ